jgi:hypothetical protein
MNLQEAIHRSIETHRDEHIEKLREFLRTDEEFATLSPETRQWVESLLASRG